MGNFSKIPSSIIGYWVSSDMIKVFEKAKPLSDIAEPRQGLATADNNRFLRLWFEVSKEHIGFKELIGSSLVVTASVLIAVFDLKKIDKKD